MDFIETLYPDVEDGSMLPAIGLGAVLFLIVSLLNIVAIRRKVGNIWKRADGLNYRTNFGVRWRYSFSHTLLLSGRRQHINPYYFIECEPPEIGDILGYGDFSVFLVEDVDHFDLPL